VRITRCLLRVDAESCGQPFPAYRYRPDLVCFDVGRRSAFAKVAHHGFDVLVGSSRMRPHIRTVRFAFARLKHLHRRLVGVDHAPAKDVALQSFHQRLQLHPTAAHPLGPWGSRRLHTRAAKDGFLAVERCPPSAWCGVRHSAEFAISSHAWTWASIELKPVCATDRHSRANSAAPPIWHRCYSHRFTGGEGIVVHQTTSSKNESIGNVANFAQTLWRQRMRLLSS
jgi:hypothetical protein